MASKRSRREKRASLQYDSEGMFSGMVVILVEKGVQTRRLQIWRQKLMQMGAIIKDRLTKGVTHIFAANLEASAHEFGVVRLLDFKGSILSYEWLENCLKSGEKLSEDCYALKLTSDGGSEAILSTDEIARDKHICKNSPEKRTWEITALPHQEVPADCEKMGEQCTSIAASELNKLDCLHAGDEAQTPNEDTVDHTINRCTGFPDLSEDGTDTSKGLSSPYKPPDLNQNITNIFGKLTKIYRALGDDRRSFSYYKAIPVIEKLPFKIGSTEQINHLPAIGKSLKDHIHEIVTTGKLSKLEHFENDEKIRTVALFGEVWGIGPATALKLYEKGYRNLGDLTNEETLTNAQKLGLKYFHDIKQKIPREEVKVMESLLQKAGETILPEVDIICGGSYRRGKAFCGDLDIIITHPDGQSHKGFLLKYVNYLKSMNFLKEDLVFSTHSEEGTDSGVDTYFGLCTYPGREQRHRIDFKVYPRDIYAFGLIAWTGNDVLNRRLRLLAESKGYRLDDTGLFLATRSQGKRGAKASTSIHCQTEREVFDLLGFPWLEPHERNL